MNSKLFKVVMRVRKIVIVVKSRINCLIAVEIIELTDGIRLKLFFVMKALQVMLTAYIKTLIFSLPSQGKA